MDLILHDVHAIYALNRHSYRRHEVYIPHLPPLGWVSAVFPNLLVSCANMSDSMEISELQTMSGILSHFNMCSTDILLWLGSPEAYSARHAQV
jgi:hypothetical protein